MNNAYPEIQGWAMVGGWPLFTRTLLDEIDPKRMKIVAVDALPVELPYVEKGLAPVLLAQPVYLWGYVSVSTIVDKLVPEQDDPGAAAHGAGARLQGEPRRLGAPAQGLGLHGRAGQVPADGSRARSERGAGGRARPPIVQFERISKRFPGVVALRERLLRGRARDRCHALCGENGAGKSTLGKILAGLYVPDEGQILLDGAPVRFASPRDARAAGIAIVHQEPTFCRNLSVAENLCLAALPRHGPIVDRAALRARAQAILDSVGLVLDVDRPVEHLTPGQRQLLQIAAAAGAGRA